MTKFGQVSAYHVQTHTATIVYARPDACEKCGACGSASQKGVIELKAECKVGDWVRVELPEGRFLKAIALSYALPLAGLMAGLLLGQWLGGRDGTALLGAAIGLALALVVLFLSDRRIRGRAEWTPRVTDIYAEKPTLEAIGCEGDGL